MEPFVLLILIPFIIAPFFVMFAKTFMETLTWSIVMHLATVLPATVFWALWSWGTRNNDVFASRMVATFLGCTLYCAPFLIYRSCRENTPDSSPQENLDY